MTIAELFEKTELAKCVRAGRKWSRAPEPKTDDDSNARWCEQFRAEVVRRGVRADG